MACLGQMENEMKTDKNGKAPTRPRKVTRKAAEEFFRKLQSVPQYPLPRFEFRTWEKVNITVTPHSGV